MAKRPTKTATAAPEEPRYAGCKAVAAWRAQGVETVTANEIAAALRLTDQGARALPIPYTVVGGRGDRRYLVDEVERYLIGATKPAKTAEGSSQGQGSRSVG